MCTLAMPEHNGFNLFVRERDTFKYEAINALKLSKQINAIAYMEGLVRPHLDSKCIVMCLINP